MEAIPLIHAERKVVVTLTVTGEKGDEQTVEKKVHAGPTGVDA